MAEYGQNYSASGAAKLMKRLSFVYKKPVTLSTQADEDAQRKYIDWYKALRGSLGDNETILFADAVHPEVSKPSGSWLVPEGSKDGDQDHTSGRKRINIQGALDLETFKFIFVQGKKINAIATRQMPEKIEEVYAALNVIHVILDNARYHHAKILQPWLESPERRVKLHFLPPYAPHLNPIERLWVYRHERIESYIGIEHVFVSWPVWNACSIQAAF